MTEEEIKALHNRMAKFRKRCTDHFGYQHGTHKFGSYAPVLVMEMLRNKTDDHIWSLLMTASNMSEDRAQEAVARLFNGSETKQ